MAYSGSGVPLTHLLVRQRQGKSGTGPAHNDSVIHSPDSSGPGGNHGIGSPAFRPRNRAPEPPDLHEGPACGQLHTAAVTVWQTTPMEHSDSDQGRKPIEQVLGGLHVHPLPAGWTALEGIVLVKCLDEDGRASWAFRTTAGLNDEELLGALTVRTDLLRKELLESFQNEDEQ